MSGPTFDSGRQSVAHAQLRHVRRNLIGELLRDSAVHKKALRGNAYLPAVTKLGGHGAGGHLLQIDVRKDQHRSVSAQFERKALHRFGSAVHQ